MIAFDANLLVRLLVPDLDVSQPEACGPIYDRLRAYVDAIHKDQARILIPAPAYAEVMAHPGKAFGDMRLLFERENKFRIGAFGSRAALELSIVSRQISATGDKRGGAKGEWQKIKVDRQIVMIAKVEGAQVLWTGDGHMTKFADAVGLQVLGPADLPEPMPPPQQPAPDPRLPLFASEALMRPGRRPKA